MIRTVVCGAIAMIAFLNSNVLKASDSSATSSDSDGSCKKCASAEPLAAGELPCNKMNCNKGTTLASDEGEEPKKSVTASLSFRLPFASALNPTAEFFVEGITRCNEQACCEEQACCKENCIVACCEQAICEGEKTSCVQGICESEEKVFFVNLASCLSSLSSEGDCKNTTPNGTYVCTGDVCYFVANDEATAGSPVLPCPTGAACDAETCCESTACCSRTKVSDAEESAESLAEDLAEIGYAIEESDIAPPAPPIFVATETLEDSTTWNEQSVSVPFEDLCELVAERASLEATMEMAEELFEVREECFESILEAQMENAELRIAVVEQMMESQREYFDALWETHENAASLRLENEILKEKLASLQSTSSSQIAQRSTYTNTPVPFATSTINKIECPYKGCEEACDATSCDNNCNSEVSTSPMPTQARVKACNVSATVCESTCKASCSDSPECCKMRSCCEDSNVQSQVNCSVNKDSCSSSECPSISVAVACRTAEACCSEKCSAKPVVCGQLNTVVDGGCETTDFAMKAVDRACATPKTRVASATTETRAY